MGDLFTPQALADAPRIRPVQSLPPGMGTGTKPTRLAVWIKYTGFIRPKRYSSHTLFDPPLDRMLMTALEDLGRHPSTIEVAAPLKDREPPVLHDSVLLLTRDRGPDDKPRRWPVAYLVPRVGALDVKAVQAAFVQIGGRA